ncbi:MAG: bifunctional oligoribonuclease/PAP phosphatase NrnA [Clostridia bacterium]|nr:bifunctional oligoribonuclease/PAP phosphatase NrnA [Clostridia bacterium]
MKNNSLVEIAEFLKGQQALTLLCHVRPDGDTLGSAFGLKDCLEAQGKKVKILCADPISPRYRFLNDGAAELKGEPEGAIVAVDIASPDMAGAYKELALEADCVIDHHATNPCYGKHNYVDGTAAAAGEIMVELAELLGTISPRAAAAFYTAIATDTGCFKYGNTTRRTHQAAAKLLETEFDLKALNKHLFQTSRWAELELNRKATETVCFYEDGKVATMLISLSMLEETGAGADELETISSLPIQIEGVAAAATFKELEEGQYKVSLRTDGTVHGGRVCAALGGGGHVQAAGCSLCGTYEEVKEQVLSAIKEQL